jgi:hypothetical protein
MHVFNLINMDICAVQELVYNSRLRNRAQGAPGRALPNASYANTIAIAYGAVVRDDQVTRTHPLDGYIRQPDEPFDCSCVQEHGNRSLVLGISSTAHQTASNTHVRHKNP